ncbi:MAG: GSCFA domain-containing protein [Bacteroidales bacterium]|nr:GSCFA domain-containing protein [Bacteroidales bacterium]
MELRTTFNIEPSEHKISYNDAVIFIGSCFVTYIGQRLGSAHVPVMINPFGTVFNPVSVCNSINRIITGKSYDMAEINNYNGLWLSFDHCTDFSSESAEQTLTSINSRLKEASAFISEAHFLFVTFGTARIYRLNETGRIVSNCHKLPASYFKRELLTVDEIVRIWNLLLERLKSSFPDLKVVFTISPVRHWKDGAHGNQVSKSVLFLAVEELLKHPSKPSYFPAYELLMDDLRDYRFYDDDMLHPSQKAVDYIWEEFSKCYFDSNTREIMQEVNRISKAMSHRIKNIAPNEIKKFAEASLARIVSVSKKVPSIDFQKERNYFLGLINQLT